MTEPENTPALDPITRQIGHEKIKPGDTIDLKKLDYALKKIIVGVGWDLKGVDAAGIDIDASLFLLDKDGQTRMDEDFVFYNNLTAADSAVEHTGDNRTGAGDGDDETILMDLEALPFDIAKITFAISIHDADLREQNLTLVRNTYLRFVNQETGLEVMRYILDEAFTDKGTTALIVGSLVREGPKWMFEAQAEQIAGGLGKIATRYGIMVA